MPAAFSTFIKHLWLDANDARRLVSPAQLERVTQLVQDSEQLHSGELRVCIEASLPVSDLWGVDQGHSLGQAVRDRAVALFSQLKVWDTAHSNGVLIYVLLAEHAIEVVADRGLSAHVPAAHWTALVARMGEAFQRGDYEAGMTAALTDITALLVLHFGLPAGADLQDPRGNPNELPDTPTLL